MSIGDGTVHVVIPGPGFGSRGEDVVIPGATASEPGSAIAPWRHSSFRGVCPKLCMIWQGISRAHLSFQFTLKRVSVSSVERQTTSPGHSLALSVPTSQLAPTTSLSNDGRLLALLFQTCSYCLVPSRLPPRSPLTPFSVRIFQAECAKLLQGLSTPNIIELQFSPVERTYRTRPDCPRPPGELLPHGCG